MNPQQQYRQGVSATIQQQMQQQVARPRPPNGLPASQFDGSNDAAADLSEQPGAGSGQPTVMSRAQIDEHLHAQLAARAKQMEGGGLMLPLKKATKDRGTVTKRQRTEGPGQFDGLDDDIKSEEDDEDAINSDLDDPDEGGEEDEDDDETMGHMMLCMYDKVQRVKNKWSVPTVIFELLTASLTLSVGSAFSKTASSLLMARNTSSTRPRASMSGKLACDPGRRIDPCVAMVIGQPYGQPLTF
jgi:hypothetical protein